MAEHLKAAQDGLAFVDGPPDLLAATPAAVAVTLLGQVEQARLRLPIDILVGALANRDHDHLIARSDVHQSICANPENPAAVQLPPELLAEHLRVALERQLPAALGDALLQLRVTA